MRARLKVSRAGIELIKSFEGLRQTATRLPDGRWTLGYGHTFSAREGARVTQEDADALLRFDLLPIVDAVNNLVLVPLNQNQFDALVSFCFNIGVDNFAVSTVLKRLNEGKPAEAAQAMDAWRSAEFNGQTYVLAPLIRRRAAEKNLFQTPETIDPSLGMTVRPVEDVVETPAEAPLTAVRQVIDLNAPAAGDAAARQAEALAEARRAEDARLREQERLERERLEREAAARLEAERAEQQRLAAEREAALEAERREAARLEAERLAAEHLAREQAAREDALRQEAARREAERLEAEKAAQAAAEQSAADDAAEKARKAEAAAALMRLYSPYGGGALGRPLVAPRPVAPSQESFVQPTPIAPAATETAPIVISAQADAAPEPVVAEAEPEAAPPVESPAESPVFQSASVMPPPVITTINPYARPQTPAPQPEAPEVRAAAPAVDVTQAPFVQASPLNWREQLQRPLPQAEPDQAETPPPVTAARGASHFDEDYGDDDGW
ncbi:MAG TPA: glycoside hydrolase family protein, partial [Asticcacaulis sp.]